MMNIKRGIALFLTAVILLLVCVGCGKPSELPEESSTDTSTTPVETHEIGDVEIYEEHNLNVDRPTPSVTDNGYYIPYGLTVKRDEAAGNRLVLSWKCDAPGNRGGKDKFEIIVMHLTHTYNVIQTEILMEDGVFEHTLGDLSQGTYRIYVHTMSSPNKVEGRNMSITFRVY